MFKLALKTIYIILILISFSGLFVFEVKASTTYTPLTPLTDNFYGESGGVEFKGDGNDLSNYINNMYKLAVGVAGVLAVLMIMWGGIEYMSTDAIGGKEEAKGRINNALLGLMIALGSYLILKTINVQLLSNRLDITAVTAPELERAALLEQSAVTSAAEISRDAALGDDSSATANLKNQFTEDGTLSEDSSSAKIVEEALEAAGTGDKHIVTKNVAGLDGGNKGCAYGVCTVMTRAGISGYGNVTSTLDLNSRLSKDSRFERVEVSNVRAGDIVVGPTNPTTGKTGHAIISAGDSSKSSFSNRSHLGEFKATGEPPSALKSRMSERGITTYGYRLK